MRGGSRSLRLAVAVFSVATVGLAGCADEGDSSAESLGEGITEPTQLEPFSGDEPIGEAPDLPKLIGFVMDGEREFTISIRDGLQAAADERGLKLATANSEADPATMVELMSQYLAQGVGSLVVSPVDPEAQAPVMKQAMEQGVAVQGIVFGPATLQVNTDQYLTGHLLAEEAARYIDSELGGKANVVILNADSVEPLRPRMKGIRDGIATSSGANVVADVEPKKIDKDAAFQAMSTVMQTTSDIDVVVAFGDVAALGALAALEAEGRARPDMWIGGIDAENEALAEISKGDSPFRATVALAGGPFGFAMGQFAADWLDGKSIPQGIDILPTLLTSGEELEQYRDETSDVEAIWSDTDLRDKYVQFYGQINYDSRGDYLAYSWTP